jgi:uncharacterized protein (DUF952 family)
VLIYKIAYSDDWLEAFKNGPFEGTAKDKEDGFIHFSTGEQLIETLKLHYRHTQRMLAISSVDAEALGEALKWEPSRNGDLFPHLYSPLRRDAVQNVLVAFYESLADGEFATIRRFVSGKDMFEQLK